jgi:DNA polymerase-1
MRTLLIDGDIVVYQYASSVEHEIDWGDDVWSLWSDAGEAKKLILQYLDILVEATAADAITFCFSDKDNFRKDIDPTYKANRKGKRKPVCYKALKEWVEENYDTEQWHGLEADDVMGILATSDIIDGEKVIVSEDKDMMTIPGLLWRSNDMHKISEEQADYYHLYQTLIGDTADGYPGLRGVGDKKATELLKKPTWETVVTAFEKAGQSEQDALVQARLARILRASDYNFEYGQPILWSPK